MRVQGLGKSRSLYLKVPFVYLVFILPLSFLLKIWIQLRLIYGCVTWQDACDSVQGVLHPHQASQASSIQFLSTLIRAGLSCQEVWQIWCPDKASYISTNSVCMSCCVCLWHQVLACTHNRSTFSPCCQLGFTTTASSLVNISARIGSF